MLLSHSIMALTSAAMLLADGCSTPVASSTPNAAETTVTRDQVTFTRLLAQNTSGYMEHSEVVIRDRSGLEGVWRVLHAGNQGAELPSVDFAKSTLVLIALGERTTGGHALRVDRVTRQGESAVVHYTVTRPGPGCMTTQVITSPVELISIARVTADVRFRRADVVESC